ncbi:MAG TPA: oligosaccharide flippase family protein [Candidatus Binataceae bacterium]|nr:oligosaccharide flippase family protein [Candidatus Binataceae bacterium]
MIGQVESPRAGLLGQVLHSALLLSAVGYLSGFIAFPAKLILIRQVGPAQYGLYALAGAVLQIVYLLGGWSFHLRIVASTPEPALEDTAYALSVGLGASLLAGCLLVAPLVAHRFGAAVAWLVCGLSAIRLFNLAAYSYAALLERELRYGPFAAVDALASLVSFVPALVAARVNFGAWALVMREAAMVALSLAGYRWLAGRRLRLRAGRREVNQLFHFGAPLALMQAAMTGFWSTDRLCLGLRADATAVGIYSQSRALADALGTVMGPLVTQVALPAYAHSTRTSGPGPTSAVSSGDPLYAWFSFISVRVALGIALPMALFPRLLVGWLLGNRWMEVAALLPAFAPYVVLLPMVENQRSHLLGTHQLRRLALLSCVLGAASAGAPLCMWLWPGVGPLALTTTAGLAVVWSAGQGLVHSRLNYRWLLGPPTIATLAAVMVEHGLSGCGALTPGGVLAVVLASYVGLLGIVEGRQIWRLLALARGLPETSAEPRVGR